MKTCAICHFEFAKCKCAAGPYVRKKVRKTNRGPNSFGYVLVSVKKKNK